MKKFILAVFAVLCLTSMAEARGRRGGWRGGCSTSCHSVHYGTVSYASGCSVCGPQGCVLPNGTSHVTSSMPYATFSGTPNGQPILIRGSDGRLYYMVPQEQYRSIPSTTEPRPDQIRPK